MNIAAARETARRVLAGMKKRVRMMKPRLAIGKPLAVLCLLLGCTLVALIVDPDGDSYQGRDDE